MGAMAVAMITVKMTAITTMTLVATRVAAAAADTDPITKSTNLKLSSLRRSFHSQQPQYLQLDKLLISLCVWGGVWERGREGGRVGVMFGIYVCLLSGIYHIFMNFQKLAINDLKVKTPCLLILGVF